MDSTVEPLVPTSHLLLSSDTLVQLRQAASMATQLVPTVGDILYVGHIPWASGKSGIYSSQDVSRNRTGEMPLREDRD